MNDQRFRPTTTAAALVAALTLDAVAVTVFAALGRRSHAEGIDVAGIAGTAWPFLAGAALGWLAARGWRRPTAIVPTGLAVWAATVLGGMALRTLTGQGTAPAFWVVASSATAVLLLGWRGVLAILRRRAAQPTA